MLRFAETAEAIGGTTSKLAKTALVSDYLRSIPIPEAAIAAIFFSGGPFASYVEATLQVGGALLWQAISELSDKSEGELSALYRRHGDAGAVAADALAKQNGTIQSLPPDQGGLSLSDVQSAFTEIATARGPALKLALLRQLLERATPLEAKYIVKIISGDLRIGLKESLVEEAIARAYETPLDQVKRANMLLGDIGETLRLASSGQLAVARMRLFHPIDFMLASPVDSVEEAVGYFTNAAVEDKYDGIRTQAHVARGEVRLFSRTRDEITESFPELPPALAGLPKDAILDGEIVAWSSTADVAGRALPFSTLQQRLGRKKVSDRLLQEVPVAYMIFDLLYADGELLLHHPLRERVQILNDILALPRVATMPALKGQSSFAFGEPNDAQQTHVLRAPVAVAHTAGDLEALFVAARARGNEGLMIKDLDSFYTPGRRGKSWLKMKRELATLDVVVTAVEYGHGKRIGVLSDYTFAVWGGDRLVNIGKAYSGLTDAEIAEMTEWFLAHTISEQGMRLEVEPKIVLEVAFNNMMRSTRHESGYALRFPRIVRLRTDKPAGEADTIETVQKIFERQG
ncbi:MAG TPA: ATP-dependent DNA ligase [Terriglobales bacterium]|nr:ATP-dependent DNA ligase [Terriglobales bacterium]